MERTAPDFEWEAMDSALDKMSSSDQKAWRETMIAKARQV